MTRRRRPRSRPPPELPLRIGAATIALLLVAMGLAVWGFPPSPVLSLAAPGPLSLVGPSVDITLESSSNCTDPSLSALEVSPTSAHVPGLHTQTFSATAVGSCGENLTGQTAFTWALSSGSLGALSSTTGPSTTYTACLAQMSGFLRVTGTYSKVVLWENVTVSVSYSGSGGAGPVGGGNGNSAGYNLLTDGQTWAVASVAVLLVALGVFLTLRTSRRGGKGKAHARPPADPQPPPPPSADSTEERPRC